MALVRFVGRVFLALAVLLMGLGVYLWLIGRVEETAGRVWFDLHLPSLNYSQVVVQRHLGLESFWFDGVIPFLDRPAWEAILWAVIALLIVGGILASRGRRRRRMRGLN
jgi:hypothetical protein